MDAISKLVFNTLAKHEGINLPGIGSLRVTMRPAAIQKGSKLSPLLYRVDYSPEELPELESAVALIGQVEEVDVPAAEEIYGKWRAGAMRDEKVVIDSVGTIKEGFFTPAPALILMLNPAGTSSMQMQKKVSPAHVSLWIIAAVVLGGALALGSVMLINNSRSEKIRPSQSTARTAVVDPAVETPAAGEASRAAAAAGDASVASAAPAGTPVSADPVQTAAKGAPLYHVVAGVYSGPGNADKFIAEAKKSNPGVAFTKVPWVNGLTIVSVYSSSSRAETEKALNRLMHIEEGMWIYTQKQK